MLPIKIQLKNVSKSFGKTEILKNINLSITEGESVVIIGGSGSGKTVLTKLISSLIKPTSGNIIVDGTDISNLSELQQEEFMKKIGYLFQLNALFDSFPIWKNITLPLILNNKISKNVAMEIAISKLNDVGLAPNVANLYPSDLSGGMQKRAALARSLACEPEIIFFDEPTSGLDPITSIRIAQLIRDCQNSKNTTKKITKISIMHDMECATISGDRIIFLKNGIIEWNGTPSELKTSDNPSIKGFISNH